MSEFGVNILAQVPQEIFDVVIAAVAHREFRMLDLNQYVGKERVIYDIKGCFDSDIVDGRL